MPKYFLYALLFLLVTAACRAKDLGRPSLVEPEQLRVGANPSTRDALFAFLRRQDRSLTNLTDQQLEQVAAVRLDQAFTAGELAALAELHHLREVTIWRDGEGFFGSEPPAAPTDDDLRALAGLERLETVRIGGWSAPFSDAGVAELERLPALKHLMLTEAQGITDEAMRSVARLEALETLNITYTRISDRGLAFLMGAERLHLVRYGWAGESKRWLESFLRTHGEVGFRIE